MITLEDVKNRTTKSGRKQFVSQFGKWLIYDRNEKYYLIVNTDVDEIEIRAALDITGGNIMESLIYLPS